MTRIRGFMLGRKLVKVFNGVVTHKKYHRRSFAIRAVSKLCKWVSSLKQEALKLSFSKLNSSYIQLGAEVKHKSVPKGHLAVYVGDDEEYVHRILVPVIYFNHALFADLLRETEKVYGFEHNGGIMIPCPVSKFENIRTMIAAGRRRWSGMVVIRKGCC